MINTKKLIDAINSAIVQNGYRYFGIRTADRVDVGQYCDLSTGWDYEQDDFSGEKLSGTCSTGILLDFDWYDAMDQSDVADLELAISAALDLHLHNGYSGAVTFLVGGSGVDSGEDRGEYIINTTGCMLEHRGAQVIAII